MLWSPPAATAVNVTPAGATTAVGTSLRTVVPSPSWPNRFAPQAYRCPVEVRARAWALPAATAVTTAGGPPGGAGTVTGMGAVDPTYAPSPSWPSEPAPQA